MKSNRMPPQARIGSILAATLCLACGGSATGPGSGGGNPGPSPLVLEKAGTDPASVVAGNPFADSLRVLVHDQSGAAKSGVAVSFSVSAGGGRVSPSTAVTDASGRAAAQFVTGTTLGINTATASISGASAVQFSTTTIAGPIAFVVLSPPQFIVVDSGATLSLSVTARDRFGNAASTSGVTFTSRAPDAVGVDSVGRLTALSPGQGFVVAASGAIADSTLVIAAHASGPVVRTDLTAFRLAPDTTITVSVLADMRSSGEKFGSGAVVVTFDPMLLTLSGSKALASGAVVNAAAADSGRVTIAAADANGLAGSVPLAALTFEVAGGAGHAGTIALDTRELTAAVTFDPLLARTFTVSTPFVIR